MTSPGQIFQKRIHDTLHSAKLPNEILFGRFQSDGSSPSAAEQPGWRRLSPDQFWLLVQRLATSTNVTRFEFSGNAVGPKAFAVLMQVLGLQKGLTHIDLTDCDIRDVGCRNLAIALEVHGVIQFLGLSRNRIRRAGSKMISRALKKCITLEHIDMSHNPLGPRGLLCIQQPLRGQSNLRHIDFSNCGFDDYSFFWMCDALAFSSSLRHIAISDNGLGPNEVETFAKALKRQTLLDFLNMSGNEFGPAGCIKVFSSLKGHSALQHVDVRRNMMLDKGLAALSNCLRSHSNLRYLDISGNGLTGVGCLVLMSTLHHLHHLYHLDLSYNSIDRRSVSNISETFSQHLANLEFVNLSNNKMGGEGLFLISQALGTRTKLKHIDLRGNDPNFTVCLSICDNVKCLPALESLHLDNNCELMGDCILSKLYLTKYPPPPADLLACRSWAELARFLKNPNSSWKKAVTAKNVSDVGPLNDAAFDSEDVHGEDDESESDSDSLTEGSSCQLSAEESSSSSSDDDSDDDWDDAVADDQSSDSSQDGVGADVGSKRKLAQSRPPSSATDVGIVPNVAPPAAKQKALSAVAESVLAADAAAHVSNASLLDAAQFPKRLSRAAISDTVIKSDLTRNSVEQLRQMCNDSGLSSAGAKAVLVMRLQARYLKQYVKLFS